MRFICRVGLRRAQVITEPIRARAAGFRTCKEKEEQHLVAFQKREKATPMTTPERRSSQRFKVRLPVLAFAQESGPALVGETCDISVDGFSCVLSEPFAIGFRLRCLLLLKHQVSGDNRGPAMCLECDVEVLRVSVDESRFRLGCGMLNVRVVADPAWVDNALWNKASRQHAETETLI